MTSEDEEDEEGSNTKKRASSSSSLREDLCQFCATKRYASLLFSSSSSFSSGSVPSSSSSSSSSLCPACLNCFFFLRERAAKPPKEEEEEEEEEEGEEQTRAKGDDDENTTPKKETADDRGHEVNDIAAFAKYVTTPSSSFDADGNDDDNDKDKKKKRAITNGETVVVDFAFPPSVAFRQSVAREVLSRLEREESQRRRRRETGEEDENENGDFVVRASNKNGISAALEDVVQPARDAAMAAVREESGCDKVQQVRDKAKASVMVYVEYEGLPSAAAAANARNSSDKNNNNDNDKSNNERDGSTTTVSEDFKAMRHFNVKRPNDRQKNWKKRKRREDKKPHWELVLSQPEPKYLAAFEDARLEYSRVYKETLTDSFLRAIENATTETLMNALYNNTYEAVRLKQKVEKKQNPIVARVRVWASPVYVAGRYAKFARDVPQSPWSNCPVKWARATESVQDALEDAIVKSAHADGAKFNSSGREDLDVRMLGDGRPFVLEVHNPKASTSELRENLVRAEAFMNQSSFLKTDVKAFNLRVVPKETYKNVGLRLDSNEKEKSYSCVCICDPPVPMDSTICDVVSAMKDVELKQQTPIRVSHRRSDLVRPRTLREIKVSVVPGTRGRCVYVDLRAEAGTYIKEFCHGDGGRTNPSLGDLLGNGTKCDIIQLDVTKVDAVGFDD